MNIPKNFKEGPYSYHQEVEVQIETLTNLGVGLGRVDGWVVMVPFSLPGERVTARIYRNFPNYSEGDLVKVLTPSKDRVQPQCPLFTQCGGCQYQHLSYPQQLTWKRDQVLDLFQRIAGLENPEIQPTIGSPEQYAYRSKLTPHYPKMRPDNGDVPIGFLAVGRRNTIIDVPHCPIASTPINQKLQQERQRVNDFLKTKKKKRGGTLLLRDTLEGVTTDAKASVTERVGEKIFQFCAGEFFQNNPHILPLMVSYVLEQAKTPQTQFLVDAYCGVGLFGISASTQFEHITGVEVSAAAVKYANQNATLNAAENISFLIGESQSIFKEIQYDPTKTSMIIDPPRKGCDPEFLQQLVTYAPTRLVYVACDPATQARDVQYLTTQGYTVERIQPFDLFPQTRHIENVVTLTKT